MCGGICEVSDDIIRVSFTLVFVFMLEKDMNLDIIFVLKCIYLCDLYASLVSFPADF